MKIKRSFSNFSKIFLLHILFWGVNSEKVFSQTGGDLSGHLSAKAATAGLDSLFSGWDSSETPGCAVSVSKDGRVLIQKAYGMADLELMVPNTPSIIFEAGSVSKQFTAAAVILLSLNGKLSLEDDVREYIPELPDYDYTITIRQLLNHTAGLRDWGSVTAISGWGRSHRVHTHDHVLDIVSRQTELNFPPGERYSYSNTGYNIAAIIVERVSGITFAEFSDEYIFAPLGMTSTEWRDDYTRIVKGRSAAYSGSEGNNSFSINRPIENVHGNGGLLTTTGDLLIWNRALASGYFGDEFTKEFLQQGKLNSGRTISYASGVRIDSDHNQPQVVHTGATSGYRAYLSYYPEKKLSVALLCNVTGANPGRLGSAVSGLYLGGEEEADEPEPDTVELTREVSESLTGIWKDPRNNSPLEIIMADDQLKIKDGTKLYAASESELIAGNSGLVYRFLQQGEGERPLILVERDGFEEEVLQPVNRFEKENTDFSDFTGFFESSDAETVIKIVAEDGQLMLHRRPSDLFDLQPVYENTFSVRGLGLIHFPQGEAGVLSFSNARVYDMRFYRVKGQD